MIALKLTPFRKEMELLAGGRLMGGGGGGGGTVLRSGRHGGK